MKRNELHYRKDVAFINRESELAFLRGYLDERPESILFIHGPKSSGKTTLLYKFLEDIQKEQRSEEAEKIWDTVGGSMWEIQYLLGQLFEYPIDKVLQIFKEEMRSLIAHYTEFDKSKRLVLQVVNEKEIVRSEDLEDLSIDGPELKELLRDMVKNNILYFDPTRAIYYPQGKSYRWGIKLYFESIDSST